MAEQEQVHQCYVEHLASYVEGKLASDLDPDLVGTLTSRSIDDRPVRDLIVDIVTDPQSRLARGSQ